MLQPRRAIGQMRMTLAFLVAADYGVQVLVVSIVSPHEEPEPPAGFPTGHWAGSYVLRQAPFTEPSAIAGQHAAACAAAHPNLFADE